MSIKLIDQVWSLDLKNEGEYLVLLALADNANDEGTQCYPSQRRITWKTGMSVRGVQAVLARLIKKGLVEILAKGNQYSPTQFALHLDKGLQKQEFISSAKGGDRNNPTEYSKGEAALREAAFRAGIGEHSHLTAATGHTPNSTRTSRSMNAQIIPVNPQIDASEPVRNSHEPSENHQTTVSNPSVSPLTDEDVEAIMRTIGEAPTQLEAATASLATETIPAEVRLGRGNDSSLTSEIVVRTEAVPGEKWPEQTRLPSREKRLEPLIQQTMKTYRKYFSSKELNKSLNSGSPIAREAARRVLAEREQHDDTTIAA
jgi:hypothetical protein